jgi:hypothetical protein
MELRARDNMKYPKSVTHIDGKRVVFTGSAWTTRRHLKRLVANAGGIYERAVTSDTDILVRGESTLWFAGRYGKKEERLRQMIRAGRLAVLVCDDEFKKLLVDGRPARTRMTVGGWSVPRDIRPPPKAIAEGEVESKPGPVVGSKVPTGKLDWERTTMARREQAALRKILLGGQGDHRCALCGLLLPRTLLVAAHRKRRSRCTENEKRDARALIFAVCVFGCDALYERGFVAIGKNGKVQVARVKGPAALVRALKRLQGREVSGLDERAREYHAWHRQNVFRR